MIHEPLETIRKHQEDLKQMHEMDELITRVESVMHVFHRLIGIMDDVAECDITVHMQDAAVLDQHATKVVTASLLLEELEASFHMAPSMGIKTLLLTRPNQHRVSWTWTS